MENFTGQWLQLRDVEGVEINAREVLKREGNKSRFRFFLEPELRRAMRRETELCFERVMREDRSLLELIDADYTYLNVRLARYYGLEEVKGEELRLVQLPKDSPRGGILTQGSILTVTSNPTRTSPVKRGLFILDNLMGMPPPPPPPDIPTLEESEKEFKGVEPTMRQIMEIHRAKPLCNACHARMDPLGLALENFNALGLFRDKERGKAIDASGVLISGEPFQDVRDLKRIITHERRSNYYRCVAEKLLTYAIGRGVETNDTEAIDRIVEDLSAKRGGFKRFSLGSLNRPRSKNVEAVRPNSGQPRRNRPNLPAILSQPGQNHEQERTS